MTGNVRTPSYRLTFEDAVRIWLMVWEGHFHNRIAAEFDVNPGRVSDVVKHRMHVGSEAEARKRVPAEPA
ncbi:hypothetical protein [Mariluticola halotolerans]|uniref:hypothetical protein n=1 Tax=Mariluticola halotolerans TaxID=2909283 RepID=UPI0026E2FCC0|nr:hypothetical protein [Mariluticola halotolerans]UJQ93036.1 hypothetical protein L1P08_08395 [Mariluticola halotolerans]